jgi:hypothetical protein
LAEEISSHVQKLEDVAAKSETTTDRSQLLEDLRTAASDLKNQADPFVGWATQEVTRSGVDSSPQVFASTTRADQDLEDLELLYDQEGDTLDREIAPDIPTIESKASDFFGGHTPAPVVPNMARGGTPLNGDWSGGDDELDTLPPALDDNDDSNENPPTD